LKKYLVFAYDNYYPGGGWNDLLFSYDNFDEAKEALKVNLLDNHEIVDSTTGEVVYQDYQSMRSYRGVANADAKARR
jgi:hypothetical protein